MPLLDQVLLLLRLGLKHALEDRVAGAGGFLGAPFVLDLRLTFLELRHDF